MTSISACDKWTGRNRRLVCTSQPSKFLRSTLKPVLGTFGVQQTTTVNGVVTATTEPTEYARNNAAVTGLFTCNSQHRLGGAFRFGGTNQTVVVNSGGNAGLTSIGTLEKANYAFIQQYIRTNGNPQHL